MSDKKATNKPQKWRCSLCEFDNSQLLDTCQMCQTKRADMPKQEQSLNIAQHIDVGIICTNSKCKAINDISAEKCKKCKKTLFQDFDQLDIPYGHDKKLKYCYNCAFQNDSLNKNCVSCQISFKKMVFDDHMIRQGKAGVARNHPKGIYCQDCGKKMEKFVPMPIHGGLPYDNYSDYTCKSCLKEKYVGMDYFCLFCDNKLKRQQQNHHKQSCIKRIEFFNRQKNETFKRCTKLQIDTVLYMHNKCEALHQEIKPLLIEKIKQIGYSEKDLDNLHHYVINYAPIIIHVRVNTNMQHFVKDTNYRNCFQIRGDCPARVQWEDRMFDMFHHRASFNERVKYGTMNFTNDPNGVIACSGYGMSYFLLKNHVRDRCTITDMDSASPTATIATFRFLFHLFIKLSNEELKAAIQASKGKQMLSNVILAYKQIQIHGPVQFSKDIERVYICKQQLQPDQNGNLALVKQFCTKNKLQYQIFTKKAHEGVSFTNYKVVMKQAPQRILNKDVEEKLNATIEKKKKKMQRY